LTTDQLAFMALAVAGGLLYHLVQKVVPAGANPFTVLFHAYLAATLLSLAVVAWIDPKELRAAFARPSAVSVLLGVAVFGIEAGFLLAYRSGWPVGWAALVQSLLLTLVLLPIGYLVFREDVSLVRLAGVALCLAGMALLIKR
jgi:drug/metabolite transporter (DMT)-like permease